ncbi:hypothetical protein [Hydrogenophaga sp.]|uniref:hypothetical protein n=2 Tax=Hydrogenophaga TaxID=47420 RepID=UPI00257CAC51|nr:hypothetical protein [Hydrogenophaga sp.]
MHPLVPPAMRAQVSAAVALPDGLLAQARAAYLGLEKDGLAKHPDELADCIRAFRHAVEARCAAASGPPAPEQ